jgi:hypothetical protein
MRLRRSGAHGPMTKDGVEMQLAAPARRAGRINPHFEFVVVLLNVRKFLIIWFFNKHIWLAQWNHQNNNKNPFLCDLAEI